MLRFLITLAAALLALPAHAQTDWPARIKQVTSSDTANAFVFFRLGAELAGAPGTEGIDALRTAWPALKPTAKQQILKAWHFEEPAPYRARLHPQAFALFQLALDANEPAVSSWVVSYLPVYAWRTFDSPDAAKTWLADHAGASPEATAISSMTVWLVRLRAAEKPTVEMNILSQVGYPFRRNPRLVEAARTLDMAPALEKAIEDPDVTYDAVSFAYSLLAEIDPARFPAADSDRFLARFKDRQEAQRTAQRAADQARILKDYDVRTIDNDPAKRWIFHPPQAKQAPSAGYGLLIVMPGGDGALGFAPFVADTIRAAAGDDYAVIQMVAPPITGDGNNAVVWPRVVLRDKRVDFTIEPLVRAAIDQVKEERAIDPKRIWTMGWSSGGPPSYTLALDDDSPVRGSFIIMSVFHETEYKTLANAKGKAFFLLHSPQDFIKMDHPNQAKKSLEAAGANVTLETYEGGHGWQGNSISRIGPAIRWLEQAAK